MSESAGLQFERAEFAQGQSPAAACRVCASELRQNYYAINGQPVCGMCCNRLRQEAERGSSMTRGLRAIGAGALAALAGAILYYAILAITGYEFGLIAIVVGLMVGKAVNWGGYGRGGWRYQAVAIGLTYLAIVSAYVPPLFTAIKKSPTLAAVAAEPAGDADGAKSEATAAATSSEPAAEAEGAETKPPTFGQLVIAVGVLAALVCAAPFLAGIQNIMGLVIIGIGLYEAWKFNKRREWTITGPHAIAATPTPASS
jgi:hypothetical protein